MKNNANHSISILLISLVLVPGQLSARQRVEGLAQPGPTAIFVHLGADLPSTGLPKRNAVAYKIERRTGSSGVWSTVGQISAPGSSEEFSKRIIRTIGYMPKPASPSIPIEQLWEKIRKYGRLDSLGFWAGVLAVRIAAGSTFVDTTASQNVKYEYSVSLVDASGKSLTTVRSGSVSFPGAPRFAPMRVVEKSSSASLITVRWLVEGNPKPVAFQLNRIDGFGGTFAAHPASTVILNQREGRVVVVEDTSIERNRIYRYYLEPLDYYGNPGPPSDTAMVASSDVRTHPLPTHVNAVSDDSLGGIRVSWQLDDPASVASIRVFRSEAFDTGFAVVAEIPSTDTMFVDMAIEPMKKYVYYLVLTGPLGEVSSPSVKTFGIYETSQRPLPPQGLRAERVKNGVRLRWLMNESFLKGYYVHRSDGVSDSLRLISPLISARDSIVAYTDTTVSTSGKLQYLYAVRAENTSHVAGPFSDTVFVLPGTGHIPAPQGLAGYARLSEAVLLWEDLYAADESIGGYLVHRRTLDKKRNTWSAFRPLPDTLPPQQNNYTDSTLTVGETYEFAVQTLGFLGGKSDLGNPLRVSTIAPLPPAPAGLTAVRGSDGVNLRWSEVTDETVLRTKVYRYQRGVKESVVGVVGASDDQQLIDKKVRRGSLYFYYLKYENKYGVEGPPSAEVGIRP